MSEKGAQLVSQRVMREIELLLHNTFSELLIVNLTTGFHFLMQSFVYFSTVAKSLRMSVFVIVWKIPLC
jgi:hypothetical protein